MAQDFHDDLRHIYPVVHALNIPNATIVEEDLFETRGSCCDEGFFEVAKCKGWWYQCSEWGVRDMRPWLKFGATGFTMPPSTEHKRGCRYHSTITECPIPPTCNNRRPKRKSAELPLDANELCDAFPTTIYLGPKISPESLAPLNASTVEELIVTKLRVQQLQQEVSRLRKKIKVSCKHIATEIR